LVLIIIEINGLYPTVQKADTGNNRKLVMGQHYRLPFFPPSLSRGGLRKAASESFVTTYYS